MKVLIGTVDFYRLPYVKFFVEQTIKLLELSKHDVDIFIVDNSCDNDYFKKIQETIVCPNVTFRQAPENCIVTSRNMILQKCLDGNYDDVIIVDCDVIPFGHWVDNIVDLLHMRDDIGLVVPMVSYSGGSFYIEQVWEVVSEVYRKCCYDKPSLRSAETNNQKIGQYLKTDRSIFMQHSEEEMNEIVKGIEETNKDVFYDKPIGKYIGLFDYTGLCFRRQMIQLIGLFDDNLSKKYSCAQEGDLFFRMRKLGLKPAVCKSAFLFHYQLGFYLPTNEFNEENSRATSMFHSMYPGWEEVMKSLPSAVDFGGHNSKHEVAKGRNSIQSLLNDLEIIK